MVTNGSFENGISEWGNKNTTTTTFMAYQINSQSPISKRFGDHVFRIQFDNEQVFARRNFPDIDNLAGHKIYVKVSTLTEDTTAHPGVYFISASTSDFWPSETVPGVATWYKGDPYTWVDLSLHTTATYNYFIIMLAQSNPDASSIIHFDGLTVIDLTATFGAGNEPDKDWCDRRINYFDGTTTIYK